MTPDKNFSYPDLSQIAVILIEPQTPGNVGSVARAMKNFGLRDLRLVNPCDYLNGEAKSLAVNSVEILESAHTYSGLADALKGVVFSVATTNRRRETHFPTFSPEEIADQVVSISREKTMAIVFGNERTGLTTEDLHRCSVTSTIPTGDDHNSLNLSHAVMIYLYEVFVKSLSGNPNFVWDYADPAEIEILYSRIQKVMELVEFKPRKTNEDFMLGIRRIFGRTPLEDRDVRILHKIFQEIENYIKRAR